jgi:hypothetical protein
MTRVVDATPCTVDLMVYAGDDLYLLVRVIDPTTGQPADLTGYTAASQIRVTPDASATLAEFAATIDADGVRLHLLAADAATLTGASVWDVQLTSPDGTITTVAAGRVLAAPEVTR